MLCPLARSRCHSAWLLTEDTATTTIKLFYLSTFQLIVYVRILYRCFPSPSYVLQCNETSPELKCGYPGPRGHGRLAGSWWPRSMLSCSVPVSDMSAMFSLVRNGDFQTCNTIMVNGQFDCQTSLKPSIREDLSRQSQLHMEIQLL